MKKIMVFTGSRADYGLLKNLIKRIAKDKNLKLQLAASSIHFMKDFGKSATEIQKDRIKINFSGKTKLRKNDFNSVINYCGNSMIEFSKFLKKSKPDLVVLLGDRFEVFSFSISAFFLNFPIIHIHGGELTYGAFDDALRHCITKMSNFHFVCHKQYGYRVNQLGEKKQNIYNFGAPGLENIQRKNFKKEKNIFDKLKIPKDKKIAVVTFHPETKSNKNPKKQIDIFLKGLFSVKNIFYIFTYSNTDPFGKYFINKINTYKKNNNILIFKTLGTDLYHYIILNSHLVIGNSSSGIIEAPSLKTPTLNVGDRQEGRIMGSSVFNCKNETKDLKKNISHILKKKNIDFKNAFYKKDTSLKILKQIKKILREKSYNKKFYDIK